MPTGCARGRSRKAGVTIEPAHGWNGLRRYLPGIDLQSDGWRAVVPKPERAQHFPMTLHHGGFPDGN
jgi:hypothetical protein